MDEIEDNDVCPDCGIKHERNLDGLTEFASNVASDFTDVAFQKIWKDAKKEIKEMKKREIAEEMFYTGATQMLTAFIHTMEKDIPKEIKEKLSKREDSL